MVLHRKSQTIEMYNKKVKGKPKEGDYLRFRDVINYFDEGDAFIFNNTRVFPARLYGTKEKTDAKIEVFLLRELSQDMRLWDVLVEPARKIRIGNKLFFGESGTMVAEVIDNTTSRGRTLRFLYDCPHEEFKRELFSIGEAPLPRYIIDNRPKKPGEEFADVALKPKRVCIDEIEIIGFDVDRMLLSIRVVCGKGTYIRALARDLGRKLGSGAYLTALRRTRVGEIRVENCIGYDRFGEWLRQQTIEK